LAPLAPCTAGKLYRAVSAAPDCAPAQRDGAILQSKVSAEGLCIHLTSLRRSPNRSEDVHLLGKIEGMTVRTISRCACAIVLSVSFLDIAAYAQTPAPAAKPKPRPADAAPASPGAHGSAAAAEQGKSGPDLTTETYGDWIMRCQANVTPKRCEVSQTIVLQGQQAPIALIAVGREKAGDPFRLVVQLPNNVFLQEGVKATLQGGETAGELRFTRCLPSGCFADMTLNDGALSKIKAQTEPGVIKFKDGLEREISLPLSLKGFGAAVDALAKS
jgi:invasion protein IalB